MDDQQGEHSEKKSAKDALLLWCQRNTRGYKNVEIRVSKTLVGQVKIFFDMVKGF